MVIPTFVEQDMINWVMALIKKSMNSKIHHFSLDFASALLANIIHAQSTLTYLSANPAYAQHVLHTHNPANVNHAKAAPRQHPSISSHALTDLPVVPLKGVVLQKSKIEL